MVRSKCINIVAADSAGLCDRIDSISFTGDRQRLAARGAAERPPSIDAANLFCVEVGERVELAIDPAAIRLLLGDGA
jgi:hypothetical protein